ncbi:MAG: N-carbamoylputrescine amidase, partial [Deltaproteobacteria bacterium]|nr:N-carbamoylputrescine amidase [Deltaproteobacteria bacterium]
PGNTGFKVWNTQFGKIGVGICWDQWFPETARCLSLMGAEILLYPTAIGSEPQDAGLDSSQHWQRVMQGHAAANILPLVASNRIGLESCESLEMTFYGSSFIADHTGAILTEANKHDQTVLTATFDLDAIRKYREDWGVYRDRRPELYQAISTLDGRY